MRARRTVGVSFVAAGLAAAAAMQPAEDPEPETARPTSQELRDRRDEAMRRLLPLHGEWVFHGSLGGTQPDGSQHDHRGSISVAPILAGRHLELDLAASIQGRAVEFKAIFSFNAIRERYETVWLGSPGFRFTESGDFDESGTRLVLTSFQDSFDPEKPVKNVSTFEFHADGSITIQDIRHDPETGATDDSFFITLKRPEAH